MGIGWITQQKSLGSAQPGTAVNIQLVAVPTDSLVNYSVVAGTLPSSLSLTGATGVITGTAPASGTQTTYNFTVRASDGLNTTDRAFSYIIYPMPIQLPALKTDFVLAGGYYIQSAERMPYSTETFAATASTSTVTAIASAAALITTVYILGGHYSNGAVSYDVHRHDLANATWTRAANVLSESHSYGSTVNSLTNAYVMGGGTYAVSWISTVAKYSFSNNTVSAAPTLPLSQVYGRASSGDVDYGYTMHLIYSNNILKTTFSTDVTSVNGTVSVRTAQAGGLFGAAGTGLAQYHPGSISGVGQIDKYVYSTGTQTMLSATLQDGTTASEDHVGSTNLQNAWFAGGRTHNGSSVGLVTKLVYSTETTSALSSQINYITNNKAGL